MTSLSYHCQAEGTKMLKLLKQNWRGETMTKARIKEMFETLNHSDDKAFIAYIMADDGGLVQLPQQIKTLEDAGVDLIEIGIPFSDPEIGRASCRERVETWVAAGSRHKE